MYFEGGGLGIWTTNGSTWGGGVGYSRRPTARPYNILLNLIYSVTGGAKQTGGHMLASPPPPPPRCTRKAKDEGRRLSYQGRLFQEPRSNATSGIKRSLVPG